MQTVARRWALLFIACGILTLAVALSSVRQHSMSGSGMFIESKYQIVCPHISAVSFRKSFEACEFECGETQHRAHSCRRVAVSVGLALPTRLPLTSSGNFLPRCVFVALWLTVTLFPQQVVLSWCSQSELPISGSLPDKGNMWGDHRQGNRTGSYR